MAAETTGLDSFFSANGTSWIHELTRQGTRALSEMMEEAVASGAPRTVNVLRRQITVAENRAAHVPATWALVAGLTGLEATIFQPHEWNDQRIEGRRPVLREGERIVVIADVPTGGGIAANRILPSDRIQYDDPTYGVQAFKVLEIAPNAGAGLVRLLVRYAREEGTT